MRRISRSRTPPTEAVRVRRTRTAATKHTLLVHCEVFGGSVSAEEAQQWVAKALEDYHTWRNGYVGYSAKGQIKVPSVEVA